MKSFTNSITRLVRTFLLASVLVTTVGATTFTIVVTDDPGEGFNDTTAASPEGGNPGTTLGELRLNVLQEAMDTWGQYLQSDVDIRVQASFYVGGGSASSGFTLASAGALTIDRDFPNAPLSNVWYPGALVNSLAGYDYDTGSNDIIVRVNISLDTDSSLPDWYYGFDGNAGSEVDLLDVLQHELGHGLGFSSLIDPSDGQLILNRIDTFSRNLYDVETSKSWENMTNPERVASAINDPDLVWTGPYTTNAFPWILSSPVIEVTSPAGISGEYTYLEANYGPPVPTEGISGTLVIVNDGSGTTTDACQTIQNGTALAGNIAYIDRGSCNFDSKTLKAQQAGAVAVIIANNLAGDGIVSMGGSDIVDGTTLTIPSVSISYEDGQTLVGASPNVVLTLGANSAIPSGTNNGNVRMYAPNPLEPGSSVSHWTTAASPDLLMEPAITPDLRADLDLSLTLMKDIGWVILDIPYPHLDYDLWVLEAFSSGATLTGRTQDAEGDGVLNIEEYFFGGDPEVPSLDRLPVMELSSSELDFVFTRVIAPADLSYSYEISTNATTWNAAVDGVDYTEEVVSSVGTTAEQVRLKLITPASGGRVLVRIRITED